MRSSLKNFKDVDAQIIAVDPHESWSAKYMLKDAGASTDDLSFPLLMDPSLTVSADYGVAFQMRIHTEISNRPSTFVIDKEGIVQFVQRGERFNDRPLPSKIMEVLSETAKAESEKAAPGKTNDASEMKNHLLFLSTFDGTTSAHFAKGESDLFTADGGKSIGKAKSGLHDPAVALAVGKGRTGDALEFKSKKRKLIFYKSAKNIAYSDSNFSGAISFWLQLDPAKDLKPGFCDPIQITDVTYNDAAIWVDFTKENPREFRLGVIGDIESWNPKKLGPDENSDFVKKLIPVKKPTFSRDKWTHVLINFKGLNSDAAQTQFYYDGKLVGEMKATDPFTWELEKSNILLGLSYIGLMDELAIFDRPLTASEVAKIHGDTSGLATLLNVPKQ